MAMKRRGYGRDLGLSLRMVTTGGLLAAPLYEQLEQRPVWLIVLVVSIVTYALSFVLIPTISRYGEYAADRGTARR